MTEREADEVLARAEAFGIDLSLLRESLKLTPTERLRRHEQAAALVEALKNPCEARLDLLPALIPALCESGVEFVLIGGLAAAVHGATYATRDLDICYSRHLDNLEKLARVLAPFSPRLRNAIPELPFALDVATLRAGCNFTLTTSAGDLDIFGELPGLGDYPRVIEYAESRKIAGFVCRVLSLEGLILAKRTAGRPKDQAQVTELEALLALREKQRPEEP